MDLQPATELTGPFTWQLATVIGLRYATWPVVALIALFVLRPYIAQVTRAAADLRELLDRGGEVAGLVAQIAAISESTADIKAAQEVALASRPEPPATPASEANVEKLWEQLQQQWQETRDRFRAVAQAAGVAVSFSGNVGVRNATKALVDKGVISDDIASAMVGLSGQLQFMVRTTADRSEFLNTNVVAAFVKTATRVRQSLKSA